jgi:hypothetical protein
LRFEGRNIKGIELTLSPDGLEDASMENATWEVMAVFLAAIPLTKIELREKSNKYFHGKHHI